MAPICKLQDEFAGQDQRGQFRRRHQLEFDAGLGLLFGGVRAPVSTKNEWIRFDSRAVQGA